MRSVPLPGRWRRPLPVARLGGRRRVWAALSCGALLLIGGPARCASRAAEDGSPAPAGEGTNIARGKPYTLSPAPNYRLCTDPGDARQLTDGRTTTAYFWTQQGTVGWQRPRYATVTVDLGRVESIQGVSMTTAAGTAGVAWPLAVYVLVSDDGRQWRNAGDLVVLDRADHGPWPEGYAIRKLMTTRLRTAGRYVRLVIVPPPGGTYVFTDEVEVFRGPAEWLQTDMDRGPPATAESLYSELRVQRAVEQRWESDRAALAQAIQATDLSPAARQRLEKQLAAVAAGGPDQVAGGPGFRAVLPIGPRHEQLFHVQAAWWRELRLPALSVRPACPWDPLPLIGRPPAASGEAVEVHTMRGEYRAAAVNLASAGQTAVTARLWFEGLPGGRTPAYITLHEVVWTDTSLVEPVAAALPPAERADGAWLVRLRPGLLQQVWLTFHVTGLSPGWHEGRLVVDGSSLGRQAIPVRLRVWPVDFPAQTTLWLGGWSYTDGAGAYGITPENRQAFLEHLQEHFVNAPWATAAVLRAFRFDSGNPSKVRLDTRRLDEWIDAWPKAKVYLVFLSVAHYGGAIKTALGGAELGSPEFECRVAAWISAWVRHLRSRGIAPNQLGVLIHDEPHEGSDITALLAWARAIRAAEPDVMIWEDPTYRKPAEAPPALFDVCDVLCPNRPMWLEQGEAFAAFYLRQRDRGRTLQFYSCSGPAKVLDPYSYYRLQAWHCWRVGGTGSFFWAFGDNGGASSWNEYCARHGPYTPLLLDADSVTPGKHMEAIRESVEDYEYLAMLRRAVQRAEAAGRADAVVARARELLNTAPRRVLTAEAANQLRWREPKDRRTADRVRVELLEALATLETPP